LFFVISLFIAVAIFEGFQAQGMGGEMAREQLAVIN
jgi:hypothetical protein